jgi:hypothetical protein
VKPKPLGSDALHDVVKAAGLQPQLGGRTPSAGFRNTRVILHEKQP